MKIIYVEDKEVDAIYFENSIVKLNELIHMNEANLKKIYHPIYEKNIIKNILEIQSRMDGDEFCYVWYQSKQALISGLELMSENDIKDIKGIFLDIVLTNDEINNQQNEHIKTYSSYTAKSIYAYVLNIPKRICFVTSLKFFDDIEPVFVGEEKSVYYMGYISKDVYYKMGNDVYPTFEFISMIMKILE